MAAFAAAGSSIRLKAARNSAEAGQALAVPADMLARDAQPAGDAVMAQHRIVVLAHDGMLLLEGGIGQHLARAQIVDDLLQEPGTAIAAAPDHHAIGPGFRQRPAHRRHIHDIAIDHDGNSDGLLHLAQEGPIGAAVVELAARAAMNRDHPDAAILGDAGQPRRVAAGMVPAGAHLQGHRQVHRLDRRLQDPRRMNLVAHERRAGMTVHHLLHRAAEIDVDESRTPVLVQLRRLGHHLGLAAGKLDRHGQLLRAALGHEQGFPRLADEGLAGDHFRDDEPRAAALDQAAEGQIRHPRHGRQDDRILESDGSDGNAHFLGKRQSCLSRKQF